MNIRTLILAFFALSTLCAPVVHAQSAERTSAVPDRALATALQGRVTSGTSRAVVPFSKLRNGELISIAPGAQLQITYFANGRQENWTGEAVLVIGTEKSEARKGKPLSIGKVSPLLAEKLSATPDSANASRFGMVRLRRIFPMQMQLRELEANYEKYRREQPENSVVAEIYLLNALFEMGAYDQVEDVIRELRQQHPYDPTIAELAAKYLQDVADVRQAQRESKSAQPTDKPAAATDKPAP